MVSKERPVSVKNIVNRERRVNDNKKIWLAETGLSVSIKIVYRDRPISVYKNVVNRDRPVSVNKKLMAETGLSVSINLW